VAELLHVQISNTRRRLKRRAAMSGHTIISEEKATKRLKFGTNFTIFLLFFGVATLEAFQTHNWLKAIFWVVIGIVFLYGDGKDDTK
jgi:hypothetical protein